MRRPTESGQLWRQVLFFLPAPIPILAVVALMVGGRFSAPGVTILLSGSVAVASLLLAVMVQPTPLPEGLSAEASVRRSLHRFRQITALRIALALTPVVVGAGSSIAGGGMFPLLAALVLAWPQLVLASPTFFTITRARRAMEGWGTKAYLWAALAQPAPVEWPIVTPLAARYRAWRAGRGPVRGAGSADSGSAAESADSDHGTDDDDSRLLSDSGLPERLAVTSAYPKAEPSHVIPGFAVSSMPAQARRILRSTRPQRRKNGPGRGSPRPKAPQTKN
ncbi:hypothetical protein ACFPZ0_08875 [Streptomonospora nanhaiensis]|uniref:Uncharacterized protein n=1 Tax=Streptomonospora nanhaiensis TaxID=1323731 RepID=A0A853BG96_9ACTN|nr:hypothetical protein [Streptomonospora nanhaiensis]NYI93754.1 hypothetical protein [Streptomonospora nanhaiensis]